MPVTLWATWGKPNRGEPEYVLYRRDKGSQTLVPKPTITAWWWA